MSPKGPFHLVTVNTAPERAQRLIGRLVEALKDQYTIVHVDNCESKYIVPSLICISLTTAGIDEVEAKVTKHNPEVLVCGAREIRKLPRLTVS
jgi:hypothetical protein